MNEYYMNLEPIFPVSNVKDDADVMMSYCYHKFTKVDKNDREAVSMQMLEEQMATDRLEIT